MPKKTTVLIVILAVVTAVLLFLAITSQNQKTTPGTTEVVPTKQVVAKTATVMFNPTNLDISNAANTTQSVDIMVDTGGTEIVGVQAELQYDPKALTAVKLIPAADTTSFFGGTSIVLFNDVDKPTPGRISYAIAINAGQQPKKGVGKIATLTFQKAFGAPTSTTVSFLDKTLVTRLGANESILKAASPLNITLGTQTYVAPTSSVPATSTSPYIPPTQ